MSTLNLSYPGDQILLNETANELFTGLPTIEPIMVQARRTTSVLLAIGLVDITLDSTDIETNSDVIQHDLTDTDRINIKQSGIYLLQYTCSFGPLTAATDTAEVEGRIRVNDTTVIPGSTGYAGIVRVSFFGGNQLNSISHYIVAQLNEGDFITLQLGLATASTLPTTLGPTLIVTKLDGLVGETGNGTINWTGAWNVATAYVENDGVEDLGSSYIASAGNTGSQPPSANWDSFVVRGDQGFDWRGPWTATDFVLDDLVSFQGSSYVNILDTTAAQDPTDNTYWEVFAQSGSPSMVDQDSIGYFDAYHSTGGVSIVAGFTDITLGVQRKIDSIVYSHTAGSAEVTVNETGTYIVSARMSTDVTVGATRSTSEMKLQLNSGGGFADISGTRSLMYNRVNSAGESSCRITAVLSLTTGDIIKMQARRVQGTDTVVTRAEGCSMLLYKIESFSVDTDVNSYFKDDFHGSALNDIWSTSLTGGGSSVALTSTSGGRVAITSGIVTNDNAALLFNQNTHQFTSNPMMRFYISLSSTTSTDARFGYQIDTSNSVEFRYDTSLANWEAVTISGGTETATDTGTAADTAFHIFEILCDSDNTQIQFKIDGTVVATNTTNIPSGLGHIFMRQESLSAASRTLTVDVIETSVSRL